MTEILINQPAASSERLHLFPGRHLGEEEFDRMQVYADQRLAPLLAGRHAGIVQGLQVRQGRAGPASEGFIVSPGLAVAGNGATLGLYYPLNETWKTLIESYQEETGVTNATGVYYLTLRRTRRRIDADPNVDPCQRAEFDPTRDSRLVVVGSLGLRRLSIAPTAVISQSRETLENWAAANHVGGEFLKTMSNAVPLGLLAVVPGDGDTFRVSWFSEAAGRYMAEPNSGFLVLLNQIREAFGRVMSAARGSETPLRDFLNANLHLDFLPAAGELPIDLLQNPASATPSMLWLPAHLGIDMVAVPEESVGELIERHLPRRVVDLRHPAGDGLRLMVAVNEPDYQPNLLDFPQTDSQLESDLFRYFMRCYDSWRDWKRQFNTLYFHTEEEVLTKAQFSALDLPKPVAFPERPEPMLTGLIQKARLELPPPQGGGTPYPYSKGLPALPAFFTSWLQTGAPPVVVPPTENGLVIEYALGQEEMDELDNEIREIRARLEKTRDYLMLQRQQLDSQTVSLAALAGGVAGDGSGLQVARWLPFTTFTGVQAAEPPAPAGAAGGVTPVPAAPAPAAEQPAAFAAFQPNILKALSSASPTPFKSALLQSPHNISSVQYTLNTNRLNRIAEAPRQALTKPAFDAKAFRFGVIEHVMPEIQEYNKAYRGMRELITTIDGLFDISDAKALKSQLEAFGKPVPPETLAAQDQAMTGSPDVNRLNAIQARYKAMFDAGQILTKQIALVEGRYGRIESQLTGKLRQRVRQDAMLDKLAAVIEQATERLQNLDKQRIERLGDYGVAQRLVDDDWSRVYAANEKRTRILTKGVLGLYFVRVRQTPISLPLADPLLLRHGAAGDIVPGCDHVENPQLPGDLDEFFDSVREVPMTDWSSLKDLKAQLPPETRLTYLYKIRDARFKSRPEARNDTTQGSSKLKTRLQSLSIQNQSVVQHWSSMVLPELNGSHKAFQSSTAEVLSLEDILSGAQGVLRRQGQELRDHLEQCVSCLLHHLNELPPSIRLQWSQLAEDDAINVEHVNQWPGLERAERDDFNATRTVAELVDWWFRQLDSKASGNSLSAMRNMIRGSLIYAALGDPAEILHGEVHVPPRRLAIGEPLRLKLNRAAPPGTLLQLLDTQQRLVALLSIDDHDNKGATAQITRVERAGIAISTQFTVVASKLTQTLR